MNEMYAGFARLSGAASLVLGANWLWAGIWKLTDFPAFRAVVTAHGVLPPRLAPALPLIPLAECILGVLIVLCCTGPVAQKFSRCSAAVSLAVLAALTAYLVMVPLATLREVGCGCHAAASPHAQLLGFADGRTLWIAFNAALAVLHVPLFLTKRFPDAKDASLTRDQRKQLLRGAAGQP